MPHRIGILGGTFDPPHAAHLRIARAVVDAGLVDEIVVIPAGEPWQKEDVTAARHRLAMTQLAFADVPKCSVSDIEVQRDGATYAIDTISALAGPEVELRYIIGSDTLEKLDTWHRIGDVARLCDFLVVPRPGSSTTAPPISQLRWQTVPMQPLDLASTDLRDALVAGGPRPRHIPDPVWDYIVANRLYGVAHSTLRRPLLTVGFALLAAVALLFSGYVLAAQGFFSTRTESAPALSSGWVAVGVRSPESAGGVVTALPIGGPTVDVEPLQIDAASDALRLNDVGALEDAVGTSLRRPMAGAIILDRLAFAGLVDGIDGIDVPTGHLDGIRAADYVLRDPDGSHLYEAMRALLIALPTDEQQLGGLVRSLGSAMKSTEPASTVVRWLEFWQSRL